MTVYITRHHEYKEGIDFDKEGKEMRIIIRKNGSRKYEFIGSFDSREHCFEVNESIAYFDNQRLLFPDVRKNLRLEVIVGDRILGKVINSFENSNQNVICTTPVVRIEK